MTERQSPGTGRISPREPKGHNRNGRADPRQERALIRCVISKIFNHAAQISAKRGSRFSPMLTHFLFDRYKLRQWQAYAHKQKTPDDARTTGTKIVWNGRPQRGFASSGSWRDGHPRVSSGMTTKKRWHLTKQWRKAAKRTPCCFRPDPPANCARLSLPCLRLLR